MKIDNLDKMIGGWFIGNFEPSLLKTNDCEVAVKRYNKGDYHKWSCKNERHRIWRWQYYYDGA